MPTTHGFIEKLAELSQSGAPFVSVTMVEAIGSTPQDTGTKMLVNARGLVFGTVGGGKVESRAIGLAQEMLREKVAPTGRLVEWNLQRDVGMTCGGVVKLYFEAYNHRTWRIVVFGAGHVAQALVRCLLEMECQVVCVDPRADWLAKLPQSGKLQKLQLSNMAEYAAQLVDDDFIVCMSMGHATDRPVLEAIFRQGARPAYLGVIGSAAKRKVMIRELTEAGITPDMADQFRCPIGLSLGTNQPGEIAISVAAELIQVRDSLAARRSASEK
jgi:xanthine dehydrogenase accessory factor